MSKSVIIGKDQIEAIKANALKHFKNDNVHFGNDNFLAECYFKAVVSELERIGIIIVNPVLQETNIDRSTEEG